MTQQDKAKLAEMLEYCGGIFNREVQRPVIQVFATMLDAYPIQDIAKAFRIHMETSEFFPTPAAILKHLKQGGAEMATIAHGQLVRAIATVGGYRSVQFAGDPLIGAVIEDLGGWPRVCRMEETDLRISFERVYKARANRQEAPQPVVNSGLHALTNAANDCEWPELPVIIGRPQRELIAEGKVREVAA